MPGLVTWSGSLHKSFRILPGGGFDNADLRAVMQLDDGTHWNQVLPHLPYERSRSEKPGNVPDSKRFRDLKQVLETCGLLWQDDDGLLWFTELGQTLRRFLPLAHEKNVILIARHAALALSVCQLRTPTGAGRKYDNRMEVFPFRFIWQAMLELDLRISSDELNRSLFAVRDAATLRDAIDCIRIFRRTDDLAALGVETLEGAKKNDRIIPIVSIASFGWTLLNQKDRDGYYTVKPECIRLLEGAVSLPVRHRDYSTVKDYVTAISNAACVPKDYR